MRFFPFATKRLGFRPTPAQSVLMRVAYDDEPIASLPAADRELAAQLFGAAVEGVPPAAREVLVLVKGARMLARGIARVRERIGAATKRVA